MFIFNNWTCFGLSCTLSGELPHRTHALIWRLCLKPNLWPFVIGGLGPRVLPPSHPLHIPSPGLGYASVIVSYYLRSGCRLCSEHLRLSKVLTPRPEWPSSPSTAGLGLHSHPGCPQESRSPEPSLHFRVGLTKGRTPCYCLAAPLGLSPCRSSHG